ncbi:MULTISPECIES: acylphosphatase [Microbacterium]|jgi:acylphosphatase|uniref:Acylphosphatase n=1 Tax=Microbacterium algihabitans TaxID=3075992 RepID=A0ABU3RW58_9MICO|nr:MULTISPECIES: acylphosphatase [Microbacterium]MCD2170685.1 acylphosphatase [Microbacterium sp. JC 701]MDQ1174889.1 acylphosphatase [Microbacterium testaceum]MDU0327114.1 acylphosphatase [Microbacterium sp. KSW2-21]
MRTATITVNGRVQGVGFRYALHDEAQRLGLRGWVRNRRDGSVEAQVAGDPDAVEALIAWAHEGPSTARVDDVDVIEGTTDPGDGFEIRATA